MQGDDLWPCMRNAQGQLLPLSTFARRAGSGRTTNRALLKRLSGHALRRQPLGFTARAMPWRKWSALAAQLPPGFSYEWTGQSREEKLGRLAGA